MAFLAAVEKRQKSQELLLDAIIAMVQNSNGAPSAGGAVLIRNLAEAYAWLVAPGQAHGGGAKTSDE